MAAVDIWRDSVTLRDAEGTRRTVALDALKGEMSSAPAGAPDVGKPSEEGEERA